MSIEDSGMEMKKQSRFDDKVGDKPLNVIVGSARNPSTERPGMIRGQAGCLVLGRGTGVAAAEAVKQNTPVNAVEIKGVQEELRRQDVILDM